MAMPHSFRRRDLLRGAAGVAGTLAVKPAVAQTAPRVQRVVLVVFGGGVAYSDVFPRLHPQTKKFDTARDFAGKTIFKLFGEGTGVRFDSPMVGHYAALATILSGAPHPPEFRGSEPPRLPTIFEYLRKQRNLDGSQAWICVGGDHAETLLAHSMHAQYGPRFGANLINARALFTGSLAQLLATPGKAPNLPSAAEATTLARLRGVLAGDPQANLFGNSSATTQKLVRMLADTLALKRPPVTGPAAADVWALRMAAEVMKQFQPTLLTVVLTAADVGHLSFRQYASVIEANDAELGELVKVIDADPQLKDSTTIIVCPDFGREAVPNASGGKDHAASDPNVAASWLVARGAAIARGAQPPQAMRTLDVGPTICALLGVRAEHAAGRVVGELLTPG